MSIPSMRNPLTWLSRKRFPYEPLIKVEISKTAILHNLAEFKKIAPKGQIAPVLKSNAYGHGLVEVATILENQDSVPFLIVDSLFEAIALRSRGIRSSILIIGFSRPKDILRSKLINTAFTIASLDVLKEVAQTHSHTSIHLKIDTGMNRQGIRHEQVDEAIKLIKDSHLVLKGICTHFSDADNPDPAFTNGQIDKWNSLVNKFKKEFGNIKYLHASNSDGHRFSNNIEANVSRLGIGLYGLTDFPNLKPALEMKSIITGIKKIKSGEVVGYGNTFKAKEDMTLATIPVGYFEGIDRRLSNEGIIDSYPIVGRVSMNITTLDVSANPNVKVGDSITVISADPNRSGSIKSMTKAAETITYDIVVHIPSHLKRIVV